MNAAYRRAKKRRLQATIDAMIEAYYGSPHGAEAEMQMLEHRLDDTVRGIVLNMHTAIEDLLFDLCLQYLTPAAPEAKLRTKYGKAMRDLARKMGFMPKVEMLIGFRALRDSDRKQFALLDQIRNICGHNWLLSGRHRRGIPRSHKKPHVLAYRGKNLHDPDVLQDFLEEFGDVYLRLYAKVRLAI